MRKKPETVKGHSPRMKPRTIGILTWLLLLEAVIMFVLGVYHFSLNDGPFLLSQWLTDLFSGKVVSFQDLVYKLIDNAVTLGLQSALIESVALFLLTILTLSTVYGFIRSWRIAWTQAIFVQGASLAIALILYFQSKPTHIFLMMVIGIFMTLYLNYADLGEYFWSLNNRLENVRFSGIDSFWNVYEWDVAP